MSERHRRNAEWKKPHSKEYILDGSDYRKYTNRQNESRAIDSRMELTAGAKAVTGVQVGFMGLLVTWCVHFAKLLKRYPFLSVHTLKNVLQNHPPLENAGSALVSSLFLFFSFPKG